jgi:predicted nucleic acid-binding protein
MITAIDTNVLIDIFGSDSKFGHLSANALRQSLREGVVYACEITWVETASLFPTEEAFIKAMDALGVEFSHITAKTALKASHAWRNYRKNGGKRNRVVADFLIGAHALDQCDRLLTRDRGFYRSYFRELKILDPSK